MCNDAIAGRTVDEEGHYVIKKPAADQHDTAQANMSQPPNTFAGEETRVEGSAAANGAAQIRLETPTAQSSAASAKPEALTNSASATGAAPDRLAASANPQTVK